MHGQTTGVNSSYDEMYIDINESSTQTGRITHHKQSKYWIEI